MPSTAFMPVGASEAETTRRAEQQRIERILAPKDDAARQRWYAAKTAQQRQQYEAEEKAKTDLFARGLLWSLVGTLLLAAASSVWNFVA